MTIAPKQFIEKFWLRVKNIPNHLRYDIPTYFYRRSIPGKLKQLRCQEAPIRVLFIVTELSVWKSEALYRAMLRHRRFHPLLGITRSTELPESKEALKRYLEAQAYHYTDLDELTGSHPLQSLHPDIILYQKPYMGCYAPQFRVLDNLGPLFVDVAYAFHSLLEHWTFQTIHSVSAQIYMENPSCCREHARFFAKHAAPFVCTGLPIQDELLALKDRSDDPWHKSGGKKRIIYAPHYSLISRPQNYRGTGNSTFFRYGEFMLQMRDKYRDQVQWCFKPHPLLYNRLIKYWGKERTDAYFRSWREAENSQTETGHYLSLFAHSDALIHDCCSFQLEYQYSHKPACYLMRDDEATHTGDQAEFARKAFDLHYKAFSEEDIEQFIRQIIAAKDPKQEARETYIRKYLTPPNGQTACDNIIDSILGQGTYALA